jgi:hypothetical protein
LAGAFLAAGFLAAPSAFGLRAGVAFFFALRVVAASFLASCRSRRAARAF